MKAIIEPRGFYIAKPEAKFRILGQQRMKKKGLCVTQDYDDAGTDIIKCKRSGTVLPLAEGGGILLLKTIKHYPDPDLREKLSDYAKSLVKKNNYLPHVVDLDELTK